MEDRPSTLPRTPERGPKGPSPLQTTLTILGARAPSRDEIAALRALMRGTAERGQQRRAITYLMEQLCGVGRVTFAGEASHSSAFRAGAQGVGVALAQIADATLLRFPAENESVPDQFTNDDIEDDAT